MKFMTHQKVRTSLKILKFIIGELTGDKCFGIGYIKRLLFTNDPIIRAIEPKPLIDPKLYHKLFPNFDHGLPIGTFLTGNYIPPAQITFVRLDLFTIYCLASFIENLGRFGKSTILL